MGNPPTKSVSVNVWQLITTLANRDLPDSEKCLEFEQLASKAHGFGNEAEVSVDQYGTWSFRFFSCYEDVDEVRLRVTKHGGISVTRVREGDVRDERTVRF